MKKNSVVLAGSDAGWINGHTYALFGPLGVLIKHNNSAAALGLDIIRVSIASFAKGLAPAMAVDVSRRALPSNIQPTGDELEELIKQAGLTLSVSQTPSSMLKVNLPYRYSFFDKWYGYDETSSPLDVYYSLIGGNDPIFQPMYWEDKDLFMRMQMEGYKFIMTSKSLIWHFTSRTSRFPNGERELDNNKRPAHIVRWEQRAMQRFVEKWGRLPGEDEDSFVIPIEGTNNPNKIEWPFK